MNNLDFYNKFYNEVFGRGFNLDNRYGAQCWDGYAYYAQKLGQIICHCPITGYVGDIYTQRNTNGILNYNSLQSILKIGDIVTFKKTANWTPYTHIAIFAGDIDGQFGWFLGQNQGGQAYPAGGACFNLCKLPYWATDTYAFRPNVFDESTGNVDISGATDEPDQILEVGSIVSSIPMKIGDEGLKSINGDLCCSLKQLGGEGWYPISLVSEYDASDGKLDDYLANTNAKVYLNESTVTDVDAARNLVKINGIWVNATPLIEIKNG